MRLGAGGASGTGGTLRASTAASPVAAPMTASSTTASRAKARPSAGSSVSRVAMLRRCSQPSTPRATSASVFSATTRPYAVATAPSDPSRIHACCTPVTRDEGEAPRGHGGVARDGRAEVGAERAAHGHEGHQPADPHDDPGQVQAERVDGVLVARRPGGVAGEGEDDDRGEGQDGEPRHRRPPRRERRRDRHDEGDERADQQDPRRLEGPRERHELGEQVGARQRRARERGEGQHDHEQRGDRPDARRRARPSGSP